MSATQFALCAGEPAAPTPAPRVFEPTPKGRDLFALAHRIGLRFGGAKPTPRGFTLHFYAGCVGSIGRVLKTPRNSLGRRLMRLLATGFHHQQPEHRKNKCHRSTK